MMKTGNALVPSLPLASLGVSVAPSLLREEVRNPLGYGGA